MSRPNSADKKMTNTTSAISAASISETILFLTSRLDLLRNVEHVNYTEIKAIAETISALADALRNVQLIDRK